jgi:hypothetical protein
MRRTIRTTTIVLGAVAATGLGLATAVAAPDTPTATATATTTATATPTAAPTGTATAAPVDSSTGTVTAQPPSYQITSSPVTVPVDPLSYPTIGGQCASAYHVAGDWVTPPGQPTQYAPSVHANGDSDIYVLDAEADLDSQNGTDSNGYPYFQGLDVTLGNHSWLHAKTGTFTWTCEPN